MLLCCNDVDYRVALQEHKLTDRRDKEASQDNNESDTIPDNDEDARQRMGTQDQTTTRTQEIDINNSILVFAVQDIRQRCAECHKLF